MRFVMLAVAALAAQDRAITQVVKLLDAMLEKSKADGANDRELYAKFKCYCDTTRDNKTQTIAAHEQTIAEHTATIADRTAQSDQLTDEITDLVTQMGENNATRDSANQTRTKANLDFQAEEADMMSGISQLERATDLLAALDATSFLQKRDAASAIRAAAQYFPKATDREALLQAAQSPAGGILGVLKTFNETMTWNLNSARTVEANAQADHDRLYTVLTEEFNEMSNTEASKQVTWADHQAEIALLTTEKDAAETSVEADEDLLATLKTTCEEKAAQFKHRNELRMNENVAIAKAISILNSDDAFATFGKTDAATTGATSAFVQLAQLKSKPSMEKVQNALVAAAKVRHNIRLVNLAVKFSARNESNGTNMSLVLESMEKMIAGIDKEEAKDYRDKTWCDNEEDGGEADADEHEANLGTLNQTISSLQTGITESMDSIADSEESLASNRETQAEETDLRGKEHDASVANVANLEDAEAIISKAIEVLQKYYDYLEAHNAPKSYAEHSGKDSRGGNYKRLPGATQEELEEACNANADCVGFTSEGWLKNELDDESEWYSSGVNLYVKTFDRTAGHAALLQQEPETFGEESEGQRDQGAEVLDMLRYILSQTTAERETAIADEAQAVTDYNTSTTNLQGLEEELVSAIETTNRTLATQRSDLEENFEDHNMTTKNLGMLQEYLVDIEPGCTFIQDAYQERHDARMAEKTALEEAIAALESTPA
jgi:hypothetical protein